MFQHFYLEEILHFKIIQKAIIVFDCFIFNFQLSFSVLFSQQLTLKVRDTTSKPSQKDILLEYLTETKSFPDGTRCTSQDECPDGMCCVHNPLTAPSQKKRFVFGQYAVHDHGFCRRARLFNESCYPLGNIHFNSFLFYL